MRVAGVDLSLASTGVVVVDTAAVQPFTMHRVTSGPPVEHSPAGWTTYKGGREVYHPSLLQRHQRLANIRAGVLTRIGEQGKYGRFGPWPDLVVIEGPSLASSSGQHHDMSGSWWRLVDSLLMVAPVMEVSPTTVKLYATGSGSTRGKTAVTKAMVVAAVRARYGDQASAITSNDVADALILAAIGCRMLGHPIEADLPPEHIRALAKVRLPEGIHP